MWGFHRTGNSFGTALIKTIRVPSHSAHGAKMAIITETSQNTLKSSKFHADYKSDFSF